MWSLAFRRENQSSLISGVACAGCWRISGAEALLKERGVNSGMLSPREIDEKELKSHTVRNFHIKKMITLSWRWLAHHTFAALCIVLARSMERRNKRASGSTKNGIFEEWKIAYVDAVFIFVLVVFVASVWERAWRAHLTVFSRRIFANERVSRGRFLAARWFDLIRRKWALQKW